MSYINKNNIIISVFLILLALVVINIKSSNNVTLDEVGLKENKVDKK